MKILLRTLIKWILNYSSLLSRKTHEYERTATLFYLLSVHTRHTDGRAGVEYILSFEHIISSNRS